MNKLFAAFAATLSLVPVAAHAQDEDRSAGGRSFSGPRIEARLGYETPTVSDGSGGVWKIGSAVSYGGELGFDVRAGHSILVGPYVNYEFSSVDLCDGSDCIGETGNLSVGGRVGVILGGKTVVYGKLGYGHIRFEAKSSGISGSATKDGVQGSLGAEFGVGRKAYVFLEGSYGDYGDFYGINLQRRQVAGGVGIRF